MSRFAFQKLGQSSHDCTRWYALACRGSLLVLPHSAQLGHRPTGVDMTPFHRQPEGSPRALGDRAPGQEESDETPSVLSPKPSSDVQPRWREGRLRPPSSVGGSALSSDLSQELAVRPRSPPARLPVPLVHQDGGTEGFQRILEHCEVVPAPQQ